MSRLILIGRNNQFPRASARPASVIPPSRRTPLPAPGNCEAGFSSGRTPDAAAGRTRQPSVLSRTSSAALPGTPPALEVHFAGTVFSMFLAGCLTVALLSLVLL